MNSIGITEKILNASPCRTFNSEGLNISNCNAGKQRYAATADLFRIYVRFVSLTSFSQISKLKSQGLIITDSNKTEKILGEIRKTGVFGMEDLFGI